MKIGNVSINVDEAYKLGKETFLKSVNNTTVDKEVIWAEIEKNADKTSFEHKKPSRKFK
jgi:hypothetical protein